MWTITSDSGSLLSVVKFDKTKAPAMAKRHGALDDDQVYLLIRSRIKESLEYMCDVLEAIYKGEYEGWEKPLIDDDKSADYEWRSVVTADEWKAFLAYEVDGITYTSHFKESLRERAPEGVNRNGVYSAAMATWTAWSKLQKNPPYGVSSYTSWTSKPDCKNCGHPEIKHSVKGDLCNVGWTTTWDKEKKQNIQHPVSGGKACVCEKYEPKPAPVVPVPPKTVGYERCETKGCAHSKGAHAAKGCVVWQCKCDKWNPPVAGAVTGTVPPLKSAEDSAAVFLAAGSESMWGQGDPDRFATEPDVEELEAMSLDALLGVHAEFCGALWGDPCECGADEEASEIEAEAEWDGEIRVTQPAVTESEADPDSDESEHAGLMSVLVEHGVERKGTFLGDTFYEWPPEGGESRRERKARQARNRQRRLRVEKARKETADSGA